jgi:hypothetical protein
MILSKAYLKPGNPVSLWCGIEVASCGKPSEHRILGILVVCHIVDSNKALEAFPFIRQPRIQGVVIAQLFKLVGMVADDIAGAHIVVICRENEARDHPMQPDQFLKPPHILL